MNLLRLRFWNLADIIGIFCIGFAILGISQGAYAYYNHDAFSLNYILIGVMFYFCKVMLKGIIKKVWTELG